LIGYPKNEPQSLLSNETLLGMRGW